MQLTENRFATDGVCWYEDNEGNSARFTRQDGGFRAKLFFADKRIKAKSVFVDPHEDGDGITLHLNYPPGVDIEDEAVVLAQQGFLSIVENWISLLTDLEFLELKNDIIMKANPGATEENVNMEKLGRLTEHDELKGMVESVFGKV